MSIIKLKVKISEKKPIEKLTDEKLSDTMGGLYICSPSECVQGSHWVLASEKTPALNGRNNFYYARVGASVPSLPARRGNNKDQRLGKLIGYCADCKCPVYSVTRKNHAGHNVITGAGR